MAMDPGQLASMQTPISGQPSRLLGVFGDVQFTNFKMPSPNIADKKPGPFQSKKQPSKLFGDLGLSRESFMEGLRKCAQAGAVQQCSMNDVFAHGLDRIGPSIHSLGSGRGE